MPAARAERALAKVNLTLRVVGRRPDGYHDIESLVVFASVGDALTLAAGPRLLLTVRGPTAGSSGALTDNLVLKAANALAERVGGLKSGRFVLSKRLPVAAGLGGGSADAAAGSGPGESAGAGAHQGSFRKALRSTRAWGSQSI